MTTDHEHLVVTDPERIRALAHPLRVRILNILGDEGEATATRCAELTGESVASCSFHLRMLAKYGFIEPGERRGREKPWRPVGKSLSASFDPDQPGQGREVAAMAEVFLGEEFQRLSRWLRAGHLEDPAWLLASTVTRSTFWATQEELAELSRELEAISDRFAGRDDNPAARPPGARKARMLGVVNAEIDPTTLSDKEPTS